MSLKHDETRMPYIPREPISMRGPADAVDSPPATFANGHFGKVYIQRYNGLWAAMKKVPKSDDALKDLQREYKVYQEAVHPNIVTVLGPITTEENKYVIPMEFIAGEELETTIFKRQHSRINLTTDVRHTIIKGMCEGLCYLHSKDIVHQDLKPDNIMVEHRTNRAVIIDLGLAKFFKNGLNSAVNMGNIAYSAPEVLRGLCQRDQRSDVWAMGKIIAELRLLRRLETHEVCPSKIRELLGQSFYCDVLCIMVEKDASRRATMADLFRPFPQKNETKIPRTRKFYVPDFLKPYINPEYY